MTGRARGTAGKPAMPSSAAYERIVDRLTELGKRCHEHGAYMAAQCPAHDDDHASLAVYQQPGRIKLVCFAGCSDVLDVLPALGMTLGDLWDAPGSPQAGYQPDPQVLARIEARRTMTPVQRAVDDILHLPDLGERISRSIIYHDNAERLRVDHHD